MKAEKRTRDELMNELEELRRRVAQLEGAESQRKRAEGALADSEALYYSLVESLPQNIFRKDREGRFTFANTNFCRTLKRPLAEVIGKTDFDFYPAELAKKYREDDKKVMETEEIFEDVERHQTPDGKRLYVKVVKTPVRDSRGKVIGIQGIFWDVTEEKRAHELLRESEERFRELYDRSPVGYHEIDAKGVIVRVNCTESDLLGYSPDEMVGRPVFDFLAPAEREAARHAVKEKLEQKRRLQTYEGTFLARDGKELPVAIQERLVFDEQGRVRGIRSTVLDITERKEAEEALAKERNLLRTVIDNLPDLIYAKDTESRFIMGNIAVARLMGAKKPEELLGKTDFDFYPRELAGQYRRDEEEVIRSGQPLVNREEPLANQATGRKGWLSTTKVSLRDSADNVVGIVGIGRDITERKEAEKTLKEYSERLEEMVEERTKELREAQEELIRKERLAVLGQLAGGVGHELRNPLGAIKNAAYFLNIALEHPELEVKETLEILEKEVATCERIISGLLDFARRKPPTRRKVDANAVVREAISRTVMPQNVEVVKQLDETLPAVLADPDQLGQVFQNIILNAVQAMPEGGRLVAKSEVASAGWVAVSIADTGVGIAKENLEKLFEPLFTTKAKGIGLGLAVTKTLVDGHGGAIEIQSEVGKGSTFTVRLPMGKVEEE